MKKLLASFIVVGLFTLFLVGENGKVGAEEFKESVQYFDSNNSPVSPYTQKELDEMKERVRNLEGKSSRNNLNDYSLSSSYYHFGETSYSNYVWIKGGSTFYNPQYVDFEIINRIEGRALYVYDSSGKYQGKAVFPKYGNIWYASSWTHLPRGKSYKFKLVSELGYYSELLQGSVKYN
ncbi:hypothetical protein LC085_20950 [Bacillus tianshenii]|uniref:hypothetical protein n=1 Tax=Sutcliffiella tianshenii TaxID=1463404 RepID=UPI001CD33932|nr:hypothetical protein [Bacillus tianshenii]MCA1322351.1 hypothetical protein [Bacillus tianshenii]